MDKAREINDTKSIVKMKLKKYPDARNSDDYLYFMVCKNINSDCIYIPFGIVMANRKSYGLPAFETVRRTRQRLQAEHPELAGCKKVTEGRMENEEVFREFARS